MMGSNEQGGMDDGGRRLSRRAVLAGAAAGGAAGLASALGSGGGDGSVYGGIMALNEAYNVSGDLWIGPDTEKANVDAESGRVYMASDTQVEYYGDDGSWHKMGVGSQSEPVPSVSTDELGITTPSGDLSNRFRTVTDFKNRTGQDTLIEQPGGQGGDVGNNWLVLQSQSIARLNSDETEVHEAFKAPANGDTAVENQEEGKWTKIQSHGGSPTNQGGVMIETGDSTDTKVPRLRVHDMNADLTPVEWQNLDFVRVPTDAERTFGDNDEGEIKYDSTIDHVAIDTAGSTKMILKAQGTDHFQLRGSESRFQASVNLNKQVLRNPRREESSTDPRADITPDDYMYVDIGGTTHYIPLYT